MKDWSVKLAGFGLMALALAFAYDYPVIPRLMISMVAGLTGYVMATYGYSQETVEKLDYIARIVGLLMVVIAFKEIFQEDFSRIGAIIGIVGIVLALRGIRFRRNLGYLKDHLS